MPRSNVRTELEVDPASMAVVAALEDDPFYRTISGRHVNDDVRRREILARYFDSSIQEGREIGRCVHLSDPALGVAVWILPQIPAVRFRAAAKKRAFLAGTLDDAGFAAYHAIVDFMGQKSATIVDEKTWYLSIVGVDPAQQGEGLGRKLLEPTLAEADALSANCYLETFTPRSERFYERLGFALKARLTEPTTGADYALMVRS